MSTAVWPAGLPQEALMGLSRQTDPNVIAYQTGHGPVKLRRSSSIPAVYETTEIELTGAQVATFDTFFDTTLVSGTLPFTWVDMISGAATTFRFREGRKPAFAEIVGARDRDSRIYSGVLDLEVIPS
jgi:hypothetical protein